VDRCCSCNKNGESVDRLLLHCDVASILWNNIFTRFGMSWVMSRRVIDLFACWWKSGRPRSAAIWKMVPICILWCVWKERNRRCFEDFGEFNGGYFCFISSYAVSLDGGFFVPIVD
jgi:hypothetical protein